MLNIKLDFHCCDNSVGFCKSTESHIKKVQWGKVIPVIGDVFDALKKWITGSKKCIKFEKYSDCKGLCGKKCECWVLLCGDCCYHKGCYEHDQCCERYGYIRTVIQYALWDLTK